MTVAPSFRQLADAQVVADPVDAAGGGSRARQALVVPGERDIEQNSFVRRVEAGVLI